MDAVFVRKNQTRNILIMVLGVALIALRSYLCFFARETGFGVSSLPVLGSLLLLMGAVSFSLNRGAFIHVDESTIRGKYHWFGKIDCSLSEIAFVFPQMNALTILLKNGKRHMIVGIINPWSMRDDIRRKTVQLERETPDKLCRDLMKIQAARQKELWGVLVGCLLLFVNIFVTAMLTGERDMPAFTDTDWIVFAVMCAAELATIGGTLFIADRCGKRILPIEWLKYRLRGAVIASEPLPSNSVVGVFTDTNFSGRIVVCGFPNDESVYYEVQKVNGQYDLITDHISQVYDCEEELPKEQFSKLIDITEPFFIEEIGN